MAAPPHPEGDDLQRARVAVLAAVADGDAGVAFDVASGLMAEGLSFPSLLFDVIAPLQAEVGKRWQQGDYGIAEEHAATGAIETLVALLTGSFTNPEAGPHVVVACAEGDTHSLPSRMIAAYLLYLGWRVTYLGSSVPAFDLGAYLTDLEPDALVLSCAIVTCLPGARASIKAAHDAGVAVLAGGRGFGVSPDRATRLGADAWAATPTQIDETLHTWQPDIAAAEASVTVPPDALSDLEDKRLEIIAAAMEALNASMVADGPIRMRVRADLSLLLDGLLAALLTRDPSVIRDFGAWHHRVHASTHAGAHRAPAVIASLRDAIAPISATAAGYLDETLIAIELSG